MQKYKFICSHCSQVEESIMTHNEAIEKVGKRCKACTKGYYRVLPIKMGSEKRSSVREPN